MACLKVVTWIWEREMPDAVRVWLQDEYGPVRVPVMIVLEFKVKVIP